MNNQCTIIVSSFDGYTDMWKTFFTLVEKILYKIKVRLVIVYNVSMIYVL